MSQYNQQHQSSSRVPTTSNFVSSTSRQLQWSICYGTATHGLSDKGLQEPRASTNGDYKQRWLFNRIVPKVKGCYKLMPLIYLVQSCWTMLLRVPGHLFSDEYKSL
ncbi:UNVERIFIED_CONTAM: hypothetical protein Sradi_6030600 [Sesamum radiatum]|uniref:Uncharacterized protein n=1 Tax=Sesamum radiatum TaxID=300843 RepID=A0AAW2KI28_SESRA